MKSFILRTSLWAWLASLAFYGTAWLLVAGFTLLHAHWPTIRGQLTHLLFYGFMFLAARALWHLGSKHKAATSNIQHRTSNSERGNA